MTRPSLSGSMLHMSQCNTYTASKLTFVRLIASRRVEYSHVLQG